MARTVYPHRDTRKAPPEDTSQLRATSNPSNQPNLPNPSSGGSRVPSEIVSSVPLVPSSRLSSTSTASPPSQPASPRSMEAASSSSMARQGDRGGGGDRRDRGDRGDSHDRHDGQSRNHRNQARQEEQERRGRYDGRHMRNDDHDSRGGRRDNYPYGSQDDGRNRGYDHGNHHEWHHWDERIGNGAYDGYGSREAFRYGMQEQGRYRYRSNSFRADGGGHHRRPHESDGDYHQRGRKVNRDNCAQEVSRHDSHRKSRRPDRHRDHSFSDLDARQQYARGRSPSPLPRRNNYESGPPLDDRFDQERFQGGGRNYEWAPSFDTMGRREGGRDERTDRFTTMRRDGRCSGRNRSRSHSRDRSHPRGSGYDRHDAMYNDRDGRNRRDCEGGGSQWEEEHWRHGRDEDGYGRRSYSRDQHHSSSRRHHSRDWEDYNFHVERRANSNYRGGSLEYGQGNGYASNDDSRRGSRGRRKRPKYDCSEQCEDRIQNRDTFPGDIGVLSVKEEMELLYKSEGPVSFPPLSSSDPALLPASHPSQEKLTLKEKVQAALDQAKQLELEKQQLEDQLKQNLQQLEQLKSMLISQQQLEVGGKTDMMAGRQKSSKDITSHLDNTNEIETVVIDGGDAGEEYDGDSPSAIADEVLDSTPPVARVNTVVNNENIALANCPPLEQSLELHRQEQQSSETKEVWAQNKSTKSRNDCSSATASSQRKSNTTLKKHTAQHRPGRAKLSRELKEQLRLAQEHGRSQESESDEQMKHRLLLAYEEDIARSKTKHTHEFTEEDFKRYYTPIIVDISSVAKGKLLVRWDPKLRKDKGTEQSDVASCTSWIDRDEFLFPFLAQEYLRKLVKNGDIPDGFSKEVLEQWIDDFEERQRCLYAMNTLDDNEEIDFCCFSCQCDFDHPLKSTFRECEFSRKAHRACCHGYIEKHVFEDFVSPIGELYQIFLGLVEPGIDSYESSNNFSPTEFEDGSAASKPTAVTTKDCDLDNFGHDFSVCSNVKRGAAVVCINAGVGGVTVALKQLKVSMKRVIYVEKDRVAQHVIRANHDYCYGGIHFNDGVEHIAGLYDCIDDLIQDPAGLVAKYGPIDIIACASPCYIKGGESVRFADKFFKLVSEISHENVKQHQMDKLFFLLESNSCILEIERNPNSLGLDNQDFSYCICDSRINDDAQMCFICNWPICSEDSNLKRLGSSLAATQGSLKEGAAECLGFPTHYLERVKDLFNVLRLALIIGMDHEKLKNKTVDVVGRWRDEIQPWYWGFLNIVYKSYRVKLKKDTPNNFIDAVSLLLENPVNKEPLNYSDYSGFLMKQSTCACWLYLLMQPLKQFGSFEEKDYGQTWNPLFPTESSGTS